MVRAKRDMLVKHEFDCLGFGFPGDPGPPNPRLVCSSTLEIRRNDRLRRPSKVRVVVKHKVN